MTPRRPIEDREDSVREHPALRHTPIGHLGYIYISPLAILYTQKRHHKQVIFHTY
jgi:hypothetical protein